MLKIAITGGAGTGKSTVARMFGELGAEVLDADAAAREAVAVGTPAYAELRRLFGAEYFNPDGELNRAKVAQLVFTDPEARQRLNEIVHPRVAGELQKRLRELEQQGAATGAGGSAAALRGRAGRRPTTGSSWFTSIRRTKSGGCRSGTAAGPPRSPEFLRPSGPWPTRRPGPTTWWITGAHWLRPGSGCRKSGLNCKKSANHLDRRAKEFSLYLTYLV